MGLVGGLYSGVEYTARTLTSDTDIQAVDDLLEAIVNANKQDSVVSVYEMPTIFVPRDEQTIKNPITYISTQSRGAQLDGGYIPRNKKLLTYPYNFLVVDTCNTSHEYRYEWSNRVDGGGDVAIKFTYSCAMSPNPEVLVAPLDYNSLFVNDTPNMSETVICNGFPQCAFAIDSFRAWLAQNASNFVGSLASASVGALTGGVGAVVGAVGIGGTVSSLVSAATAGSKLKGTQATGTEVGLGKKGIYFKHMSVQQNYARVIDDYFDRYGYACCEIKVPNRNVRQHWTYTKTQNACVTGNAPVDALAKIKSIYNNGVTFWNNGDDIGNYNQVNGVID